MISPMCVSQTSSVRNRPVPPAGRRRSRRLVQAVRWLAGVFAGVVPLIVAVACLLAEARGVGTQPLIIKFRTVDAVSGAPVGGVEIGIRDRWTGELAALVRTDATGEALIPVAFSSYTRSTVLGTIHKPCYDRYAILSQFEGRRQEWLLTRFDNLPRELDATTSPQFQLEIPIRRIVVR